MKESYCYDEKGLVSSTVDHIANTKTVYSYDTEGKPTQVVRFDKNGGLTAEFYENVTYNSVGLVSTGVDGYALNGTKYTDRYTYAYDALQRLSVMYYGQNGAANRYTYAYDGLSRVTNRTLTYDGLTVSQNYTYAVETGSFGESETGRIESVTQTIGSTTTTYTYTYDDRGNITHIYVNGQHWYSYEYDNLNQLVRENDAWVYVTYTYSYDDAGNLLTKTTYPFTHGTLGEPKQTKTYTYGSTVWGDKLTQYNIGTMSFDALGNPTSYYNDYRYTNMTWTHGRQLASLKKNLSGGVVNTVSYSYNADGIRTGKVVNGTTVEYVLNGTQILAEKNGDHIIRYVYDAQGLPVGMILDGTTYLYEKNIFGDVVGIYDTNGTKVVVYKYSAWGVLMDSTCVSGYEDVRRLNPFRYRGYYFDTETDFYYLQSRYYDPRTGRFINADSRLNANGDIVGFNMYAYCSNNVTRYSFSASVTTNGKTNDSAITINGDYSNLSQELSFDLNSDITQGLTLKWFFDGINTGSTIQGLYTSISGLVNHTMYFAKNLRAFSDDLTMIGVSTRNGILAFNQFDWTLGKADVFGIVLGVGLDIYDSIQRGVSPGGVLLGATLTAVKGIGFIYLNKGILYGATAIGSLLGPHGAVVGFVLGGVICIVVDVLVSNEVDGLIDKIAK